MTAEPNIMGETYRASDALSEPGRMTAIAREHQTALDGLMGELRAARLEAATERAAAAELRDLLAIAHEHIASLQARLRLELEMG